MTWFKSDDGFWRHRKVRKLGKDKLGATGLWQLSGTWCADNTTDGFVPIEQVKEFGDTRLRFAKRLVEVGLWTETECDGEQGYQFHDWANYQPMRDEIEKRRIEDWMRKDLYARPGLVQAVKDRDGDLCRYCGLAVRWSDRRGPRGGTIDHLQPVSRHGKNELENLVVACRSCNSRKQDRTPDEAGMPLLPPQVANPVTSSGPKSELDGNENGTGNRQSPEPVPGPVPKEQNEPPAEVRADTAQAIVGEWIERCPKRPPGNVIGQISKTVKALLAESIDPDDVRRGLAAWMAKGLHPSTLASVVNEVMNRSATPRAPNGFVSQTDANIAALLGANGQPPAPLQLPRGGTL